MNLEIINSILDLEKSEGMQNLLQIWTQLLEENRDALETGEFSDLKDLGIIQGQCRVFRDWISMFEKFKEQKENLLQKG